MRHPLTAFVLVTSLLEHARGTTDTAPANRCYNDFSALGSSVEAAEALPLLRLSHLA